MENNNEMPNNQENNENNVERKDSGGNNDNEAHTILEKEEKEEKDNNALEIESQKNNNNKRKKENFFHDKDITEDSIIYFANKLKQNNDEYKICLYSSIILYIIDIFIWFIYNNNNLHNFFNLLSLIIILICVIYQAYIFKHNFENISKELYNFTRKIIYIYNIIVVFFLTNMIYIAYKELFYKKDGDWNTYFDYPLVVFFYICANITMPSITALKFIYVKKSIKNLSAAKGEIYESAKIEEAQIINSIINES